MKQINTKILFAILILLTGSQANAQEKKYNFGLKIAPAISWLNIEDGGNDALDKVSSDGALPKFNWGFIGIYNFSENFGLASGFNVNSLGGNVKSLTNGGNKYKYSEVQLPFIFQMKSNEILNFNIFVQLGIAGGLIISAKDDNKSIYYRTKDLNSAFIIAGGIYYPIIGGINLMAQFKYNGGLSNISKADYDKIKTNFVELTIGVLF